MLIIGYVFTLLGCSKEDGGDENIFLESSIVTEFIYEGKKYVETDECDEKNEFNCLFGYLINAEDLEKWKEIDNDESISYVINSFNTLFRVDHTGHLTNRFEIYFANGNINNLAVSISANEKIIYRVKG